MQNITDSLIVMLCEIWDHLYNLKNLKNTHEGVLILVKATLLHWRLSRFLNGTNGTKSCKASGKKRQLQISKSRCSLMQS